jgi:hypothetical protein
MSKSLLRNAVSGRSSNHAERVATTDAVFRNDSTRALLTAVLNGDWVEVSRLRDLLRPSFPEH